MQAEHQRSSDPKAITSPTQGSRDARHLMAIRIVGTALFDYQVQKTSDTRIRLEAVATFARQQGDLTANEVAFLSQLLATSTNGASV